jgi:hypothetical protein
VPDFPDIHAVLCREKRVKKRVIAGLIIALFYPLIAKLGSLRFVGMNVAVQGRQPP